MHWHAFGYDGAQTPADRDAKNPQSATPPLALSHWFNKPTHMHKDAFADVEGAFLWLESELRKVYATTDELFKDSLAFYRMHLELRQDAYASGYTRDKAGIYVRCLLTCPRTGADPVEVNCPGAPK